MPTTMNDWPGYERLDDTLFGAFLADANLQDLSGLSDPLDMYRQDMAALLHPAPLDLPDLDFVLPTRPATPVHAVPPPPSPLPAPAWMGGGECPRCGAHQRSLADLDARLVGLEATIGKTASAFEALLPRATGALQNLIDVAVLFDDSVERLKRSMGLFTRGIVEHFFGDEGLADVEMCGSCDP